MKKHLLLATALVAVTASAASAQVRRPVELGIDAGVDVGLGDDAITTVSIPAQAFRVGFFISDNVSLEPKIALNFVNADDASASTYRGELGLLYHLGMPPRGSGVYIRPFAGFTGFSVDPDDGPESSDSNGYLGAGIGVKIPFMSRMASRFEANFAHQFGGGGSNTIGLLAGLSFFTR